MTAALGTLANNAINLMHCVERRNIGKDIAWLETRMQRAFQKQGRELVKRLAKNWDKAVLKEAADGLKPFEDDLNAALDTTAIDIIASLNTAVKRGLQSGGDSLISQVLGGLGGFGDGGGPKLNASVAISFHLRSPRAIAYLKNYGANQVVGINDTTRTRIRNLLIQGLEERWSFSGIAQEIKKRFSQMAVGVPQLHLRSRAELIAATELGNAFEEGSMIAALQLEAAERTMEKLWLYVADGRADENCIANGKMGWLPIGATFASGSDRPLDHPACRCSLAYRVVAQNHKPDTIH